MEVKRLSFWLDGHQLFSEEPGFIIPAVGEKIQRNATVYRIIEKIWMPSGTIGYKIEVDYQLKHGDTD